VSVGRALTFNTVVTDGGGGISSSTERFRISSDGRVGVNIGNPQTFFNINRDFPTGSTQRDFLRLTASQGGAWFSQMGLQYRWNDFGNGASWNLGSIDGQVDGWSNPNGGGALVFYTKTFGAYSTDPTEKMRISSSGQVTIPNQPAWSVGLNGAQSYLTNVPSVIFWNQSSGNDCFVQGGVSLNGDLGRITVPVAGKYLVFASIRTEATGAATTTNLNLRRNGTTILRHYVGTAVNSAGSFMYIETRPVIINCAANDFIDFQFDSIANDFTLSATSNTVVRFGGHLVG
jgi:hypothetical protein